MARRLADNSGREAAAHPADARRDALEHAAPGWFKTPAAKRFS